MNEKNLQINRLENENKSLEKLLPLYQKQLTEICELKGEIIELTKDRNRLLKKLSEV